MQIIVCKVCMDLVVRNSIISGISFLISYILVPLTDPLSRLTGAMDMPDGMRRINTKPMPRLGGLAFYASFFITSVVFIGAYDPYVGAILTGGSVLVAAGVADDTHGLNSGAKFAMQIIAAIVAILMIPSPERISIFGIVSIPLFGVLSFIVPLFRTVFTCNAVNFSDGLDGLAAGLGSVALISISVFALINGNKAVSCAALSLGFATLGFLPHNKYHAKVFMGDCGSQFLGFSIAILSLGAKGGGSFSFESSLFLAVPMIDVWVSVARRIINRKNPFIADKGHLHHLLLKKGFSHSSAVKLLVSLSALIALFTLGLSV